jgi:glycosyltransferase involved in cell wall biosynthesis
VRILHVVTVIDDLATYGGQVAVALNQCSELQARGHEVRLLAGWRAAGEPPEQIEQIPVQLFRVAATGNGAALARAWLPMTAWLRRNADRFDLAHLHLSPQLSPALAALLLARAQVPYLVQTHGLLTVPGRPVLRRGNGLSTGSTVALRCAARVLAADPAERQAVTELVGSADGITVLRHAVPATGRDRADRIDRIDRVDRPVRRPATPAGRTRALDVLLVCRLHPDKGVLVFAEAARTLLAEGLDARFTVLGPDAGGRAALVRYLGDHPELTGRLVLSGPTSHEKSLERIRRADLFVLPPGDGSHSMALLEALAAGVPAICTNDYGHAIPLRAQQGVRVTRPTAQALAHAIRALAADPPARAALGARGRDAVAAAFGIRAVVDELEQVYAEALAATEPVAAAPSAAQVVRAPRRAGPDRCLAWLTSEVSDDRLALWREVGRLCELTVALIGPSEADWKLLLDGGSEPFTVVPLGSRWAADRTLQDLVRSRPDAVVLDGWRSPVYRVAARLARRNGVAVVVTLADPQPASTGQPVATEQPAAGSAGVRTPRAHRRLLRQADAVLTAGSAAMDAALSVGVRADRIAVRPQPAVVDLRGRGERASVIDVREGHRFLYLGPLVVRRNVETLLHGFHLARAMGDVLTVCGSGPLRARLSELAARLGIDEAVTFIAEQDAPARAVALAAAHTVILPGGYDTGVRLVGEALAAGRHVVVGSAGAMAAVASPNLFVADPTPAGLSRAMMSSRQRWTAAVTGRTGTRV